MPQWFVSVLGILKTSARVCCNCNTIVRSWRNSYPWLTSWLTIASPGSGWTASSTGKLLSSKAVLSAFKSRPRCLLVNSVCCFGPPIQSYSYAMLMHRMIGSRIIIILQWLTMRVSNPCLFNYYVPRPRHTWWREWFVFADCIIASNCIMSHFAPHCKTVQIRRHRFFCTHSDTCYSRSCVFLFLNYPAHIAT